MVEVFHNTEFLMYMQEETLEALSSGHFECVARIDTDSLDEAYELTQNIDQPWTQNPKVATTFRNIRSTSVGDLVRKDGVYHVVESCGFKEITREQECSLTFLIIPGELSIGKSHLVKKIAQELGVPCIDFPLSGDQT